MSTSEGAERDSIIRAAQFATTHWSVVLSAVDRASPDSEAALARLCQSYWYPLYAYVRRRGNSSEDAQDLTQSFFASLLEKKYLDRADRERGRFRTFLLRSLENFLHNEWDRAAAQKRGGGHTLVSWDERDAEGRYVNEPVDDSTPEKIFEKRWAATLLELVLKKMREEFIVSGKAELLEAIKPHLWSEGPATSYSQLAVHLNMTVVAVKVTVHRLRHRYRDLLRAEIAHTVATPGEVDDEIRHLIKVMSD
jgi:RNA polymerase sigma-70 factor (ECF subfamily)